MDGIAIRHAEFAAGERVFGVAGTLHAGDTPLDLPAGARCIEVMTGAVLPPGADCVIPVERIERQGDTARLQGDYVPLARQCIHARGSDHRRGHTLLEPGTRILPNDVALLASAGLASVTVSRNPSITVISTGNELVAAGEPIAAHQVRLSNGPALVAMLRQQGYTESRHEHLADDPDTLRQRIGERLATSDVLVLSGGVSMGQADFVPRILAELGVRRVLHRIAQRPGKPMWFGTGAAGQAVFALPGNPVSAMVCCRHYVLPALLAAGGAEPSGPGLAVLAADYRFEPDLTCFVPVRVTAGDDARLVAEPVVINTSGDFSALSGTRGYVELARETSHFPAGSVQPLHDWTRP